MKKQWNNFRKKLCNVARKSFGTYIRERSRRAFYLVAAVRARAWQFHHHRCRKMSRRYGKGCDTRFETALSAVWILFFNIDISGIIFVLSSKLQAGCLCGCSPGRRVRQRIQNTTHAACRCGHIHGSKQFAMLARTHVDKEKKKKKMVRCKFRFVYCFRAHRTLLLQCGYYSWLSCIIALRSQWIPELLVSSL